MELQLDDDASDFFTAAMSFLDGEAPDSKDAHLPPDDQLLDLTFGEPTPDVASLSPLDVASVDAELLLPLALETSASVSFNASSVATSYSFGQELTHSTDGESSDQQLLEPFVTSSVTKVTTLALPQGKRRARKPLIHSNSNKARDERKLELLYLRQKVTDMEQQLRTLHASRVPRDGRKRARPALKHTPSQGQLTMYGVSEANQPHVWKAMCLRQIQHRAKAERENVRLKRVLEGQIKVAKSMEKLLRKPTEHIGASLSKRSKALHVPPTDPNVDNLIFQELLGGIEATYHEVDDVFQINGLTTLETSHRGAQMREGEHGLFLDVFVNSVLPFDMHSTAEAVWQHYKGPQKHHGSLYQKTSRTLEPTEDTIIENFALELFANNTLADFRVWQVVRRYVEEDRVVIVWISDVVPVEVAHKQFSGVGFREKGYVVCKRPRSTAETSPDAFTVVQVCYRITPHATNGGAHGRNSSNDIGTLTEFVLGTTEMNVVAHQELIENVLLEHAFKRREQSTPPI